MSDTQTTSAGQNSRKGGFMEKHYHVLRRLHSLSGVVPIGVFLIAHLTTNSSLLWGKWGLRHEGSDETIASGGVHYFWKEVQWINNQIPHLLLIEIGLWAAIAFHSVLGVYYARSGKSNTARYAYQGNWRYRMQRVSGYVALLYIFYHIATLRWGWDFLVPGGTKWSDEFAASSLGAALRGSTNDFTAAGVVVSLFYFVGITATVYHFANGLWTAAITWGLTISKSAQQRWGFASFALGVALMGMAWASLAGALMTTPASMKAVELELLKKKGSEAAGTVVDAGEASPEKRLP